MQKGLTTQLKRAASIVAVTMVETLVLTKWDFHRHCDRQVIRVFKAIVSYYIILYIFKLFCIFSKKLFLNVHFNIFIVIHSKCKLFFKILEYFFNIYFVSN